MYSVLLPTGDFLEASPDVTFELNNQVFSTSDTSVLPGSYSFPFNVDGTPTNRVLLGFPDVVTNASTTREYAGAWLCCYGVKLFRGTLLIQGATTGGGIRVALVVNPLRNVRDRKLPQLSGLDTVEMSPGDLLAHMLDTVNNPEDFNHIFLPLRILADTEVAGEPWKAWHNYFNEATGAFHVSSKSFTAHVSLFHVLQCISNDTALEFKLLNEWQLPGDYELRRLYFYNNRDIRVSPDEDSAPVFTGSIPLKNHLPDVSIADLLKALGSTFALGIFTDLFAQSIRLKPLNTVLQAPPAADWSDYAVGPLTIEVPEGLPDRYAYEGGSALPADWPDVDTMPVYYYQDEAFAALNVPEKVGTYAYLNFLKMACRVDRYNPSVTTPDLTTIRVERGVTLRTPVDATYSPSLRTIAHTYRNYFNNEGGVTGWESDGNPTPKYAFKNVSYPFGLMWYRGVQLDGPGIGDPYPLATDAPYLALATTLLRSQITGGDASGENSRYALNWNGPYGLYEQWHRRWREALQGKPCTQVFHLPVTELVKFSLDQKIQHGQMQYFVKRLRIGKALGRGLVQVEASLLSVI